MAGSRTCLWNLPKYQSLDISATSDQSSLQNHLLTLFKWNMTPGRRRGTTLTRRPTILIDAQAQSSGRDFDAMSNNFTLAGPAPIEALVANQPYVDPGYTELNPAYDQPQNTRPVWGLAKPLPRVIRPGMVPSKSELNIQIPDAQQQAQDAANADLEQGRVDATLNVGRIGSQLQQARHQREFRMLQRTNTISLTPTSPVANENAYSQGHQGAQGAQGAQGSSPRPISRQSRNSQVIEEEGEEDLETKRPRPSLEPVPESVPAPAHYYPDDAASAITEKAGEGDLEGGWIGDEVPLAAYDAESDEVHNLHTRWSVIRLAYREPLAELLAVSHARTTSDAVSVLTKAGYCATHPWLLCQPFRCDYQQRG